MTAVEIALVLSISGSVLAASVPTFLRQLHASRFVEAEDGLAAIAQNALVYSQGKELAASFPLSAPLTPAEVPRGVAVTDPPGTWDHPTWKALSFSQDTAHRFAFSFDVANDGSRIWFTARANGDLSGDGITSVFEVVGERRMGQSAVVLPGVAVHREVE